METIMKVEGMSCGHCKDAVTNNLLELDGVASVDVNLEEKTVTINHSATVSVKTLSKKIEEQGYDVV
jgi:copper chaperone